jgi:hypothetical protein
MKIALKLLHLVPLRASLSGRLLCPSAVGRMVGVHRGIKYSVARGKRGVWEWRVSMGEPEVLRTGKATTAYHVIEIRAAVLLSMPTGVTKRAKACRHRIGHPNMAAITTAPTEIQMAARAPTNSASSAASPTRRMRLG